MYWDWIEANLKLKIGRNWSLFHSLNLHLLQLWLPSQHALLCATWVMSTSTFGLFNCSWNLVKSCFHARYQQMSLLMQNIVLNSHLIGTKEETFCCSITWRHCPTLPAHQCRIHVWISHIFHWHISTLKFVRDIFSECDEMWLLTDGHSLERASLLSTSCLQSLSYLMSCITEAL